MSLSPKVLIALLVGCGCLVIGASTSSAGGLPGRDDTIVYECSAEGPGTDTEICAVDPDGMDFRNLSNDPTGQSGPEISPDGRHIAYRSNITELWMMDTDGGNQQQITDVISAFGEPTWSPDSKTLAASCNNPDNLTVDGICLIDVATGEVQFVKELDFYSIEDLDWSPDGKRLLFSGEQITGGADLYVMPLPSGAPVNITNSQAKNEYGTWSPDGREIAFVGNPLDEENDNEPFPNLYRINPDGSERELLYDASSLGPSHSPPAYSPDGREIAWSCSDSAPSAKDLCINDAESGSLLRQYTEGENGVVQGTDPHWAFVAGPVFGDWDCDGDADEQDGLALLQNIAGVDGVDGVCVNFGETVQVNGEDTEWGDADCDGDRDANDALQGFLAAAGLPAPAPGCPPVGTLADVEQA